MAFYVGLFIAMPVVIYHIWAFVAPGLYRREKRFAVPLLVSSVILFYTGAVFAYYAVFPVMFTYLVGTAPAGVSYMPDMASYLDFVLTLFFDFGVAFEMPIAVVLLVITGLVNVDTLGKNRGYVIIGIFVVAAFLTPPDAISQCIMALPMYLLYEGGLVMARIMLKMRGDDAAAAEKEEASRLKPSLARQAASTVKRPPRRSRLLAPVRMSQTRRHRATAPTRIRANNNE